MTKKILLPLVTLAALLMSTPGLIAVQKDKGAVQLNSPATRNARRVDSIKQEVRHELVTLPYYNVFDWLQGEVKPDGTVILSGEVTRPTTKNDAEARVKSIESVSRVVNNIEVLPLSTVDDQTRVAVYRAIFKFDSPLFRYGTQSVPPIHIIVKNGHVTLKGIVANEGDSQLAALAANGVPGVFEVKNELQIEQRVDEKVSKK